MLSNLASVYLKKERFAEATALYEKALSALGDKYKVRSSTIYNNLGNIYAETNDNPKAIEYFTTAYEGLKQILGSDHPNALKVLVNLAEVRQSESPGSDSTKFFMDTLDRLRKVLGSEHPLVKNMLKKNKKMQPNKRT